MKEKKSRKEWIKTIAIIFLSVLLVLTFFSNTIMNYSLPEVSAQYCYSDEVTNKVRGTGVVEANDPYSVTVTETRKIESVAVQEGDTVEKGDVLYTLEDGESAELKEARQKLEELESDYEQAVITGAVSSDITDKLESGTEDSLKTSQAKIQAAKELQEYWQARVDALQKQNDAFTNGTDSYVQAKKDLADAEAALKTWTAQNEKDSASLSAAETDLAAAKEAVAAKQAEIDADEETLKKNSDVSSNDYGSLSEAEVYDLKNKIAKEKAALKTLQSTQKKAQTTYNTALANYNNSANMVTTYTAQVEACTKAIEDQTYSNSQALADAEEQLKKAQDDYTQLLSDLSTQYGLEDKITAIKDQQKVVDDLEAGSMSGTITAPIAGTIISMAYAAGQTIDLTNSTEVAQIQKAGDQYTLSMSVTINQAQLISVGDEADVANSWYYSDVHARVSKIMPDKTDPTKNKTIVFELEGNDLTNGMSLTLTVGNRTANYDMVVPNSAIREDNNGKFILIVNSKSTPLGTRYIADRVDVKVLAQDDNNTAISANMEDYSFVITTTSKPVEDGQQVRLKE